MFSTTHVLIYVSLYTRAVPEEFEQLKIEDFRAAEFNLEAPGLDPIFLIQLE